MDAVLIGRDAGAAGRRIDALDREDQGAVGHDYAAARARCEPFPLFQRVLERRGAFGNPGCAAIAAAQQAQLRQVSAGDPGRVPGYLRDRAFPVKGEQPELFTGSKQAGIG